MMLNCRTDWQRAAEDRGRLPRALWRLKGGTDRAFLLSSGGLICFDALVLHGEPDPLRWSCHIAKRGP